MLETMPIWFKDYLKSLDRTKKDELFDYIESTSKDVFICDTLEEISET